MKTQFIWLLIGCLLIGALSDFLMSGVFKIIWAVVYVPAYVVGAKVIISQLSHTRFEKISARAAIAFVAGAFLAHLLFMNSSRLLVYSMKLVSVEPLTLASAEWPQKLLLSSARLSQLAPSLAKDVPVPVVITIVSDYGCHLRSTVDSVAGVVIESDPEARWTWKLDAQHEAPKRGPGYEDCERPWCWIHFYRRS